LTGTTAGIGGASALTQMGIESLSKNDAAADYTRKLFAGFSVRPMIFVIASGEVRILIDGKPIRDLCKNAYFGERSLLSGENRSATIEAVSSTGCCGSCSTPLLELRTPSSQSRKRMAKFQKNWLVSVSCWLPTITRSSCSW